MVPSVLPYRREWLRSDLVAGLTVWAVLVPEALAYASIAGVSPVVGLYAAPAALLFYALLGSSRQLIVGPMSATAALSAAAVGQYAAGSSADFVTTTAALAVVTGIIALVAGLLRLGFVASLISEPVLKGFIVGLALTIIIGQVPGLLGVEKEGDEFFDQLGHLVGNLGDIEWTTFAVGALSLALVLGLRHYMPAVPGSLVAVAVGVLAVKLFALDDHGVAIVGQIDSGLPSLGFPDASASEMLELGASAAGIALVGFAEGLGAAKTYAAKEHYEIDTNRELMGLGAANIGAGLSSGMVVNGSLSKTAVNGGAGAKSQVSGLVVAVLTVVTLLVLTGLFEELPEATLGAVVIAAVIELVDFQALARLRRIAAAGGPVGARPDFVAAVTAMMGVLVFGTLPGLFLGIVSALGLLVYRAARPNIAVLGRVPGDREQWGDVARHSRNEPEPGIVVLRVEAGLFFANADHVRSVVRHYAAEPGTKGIVLDAASTPFVDVTAADMLLELREEIAREGVVLAIARDIGQVRDVLRRSGDTHGPLTYPTLQAAIEGVRESSARRRSR